MSNFILKSNILNCDSCIIFIHGAKGNASEAKIYKFLTNKYDVIGLDYEDGNAWEVNKIISEEFEKIVSNYKHINVIANSIGAFYTFTYLTNFNIEKALFISPFVSMKEEVEEGLKYSKLTQEEFKEKKFIYNKDHTLISYDFYNFMENFQLKWNKETFIIYGENDEMVPRKCIDEFVNKTKSNLFVYPNGKHYFYTLDELRFIKKYALKIFRK